jgi:hypothetical protein
LVGTDWSDFRKRSLGFVVMEHPMSAQVIFFHVDSFQAKHKSADVCRVLKKFLAEVRGARAFVVRGIPVQWNLSS